MTAEISLGLVTKELLGLCGMVQLIKCMNVVRTHCFSDFTASDGAQLEQNNSAKQDQSLFGKDWIVLKMKQ